MKKEFLSRCLLPVGLVGGLCLCGLPAQEVTDTLVSLEPGYRRVLMEEFTGMHCQNCPAGHRTANEIQEAYGDYCHVINIHAGSLATPYPGQTDLRSAYGEALATQAGVTGIPSVSVNRHLFSSAQTAWAMTGPDTWFDYVDEVAGMETYVNVGAEATIDWQSRELDVTVQLYYTGDAPEEGNRIHVAVVQDNVEGYQIGSEANPDQVLENGNYLHQHVLRDLLTGLEGDLVETVAAGTLLQRTYSKVLPESLNQLPMEIMDLQVVVFVSEAEGEVMDACQAPVCFVNGPEYVFGMSAFGQLARNTCDNLVRLAFDLENRNPEDRPVENVTFLLSTPQGQEHECTFSVEAWDEAGMARVETDAVPVDETGVEDTLFVQVVAVNGEALTQFQEPVAIPVLKEYVSVGEPSIVLDLWQDRWGSEINWSFRDEAGNVLDEVASYPDLSERGTERHTHEIALSEGCNVFVLRDLMHDGINNGMGEGRLQLSDAAGEVILENDGTYTDSLVWLLRYSPAGNEVLAGMEGGMDLRLWPNPSSEAGASLAFNLEVPEALQVSVWTVDGRQVFAWGRRVYPAGRNVVALPVGQLDSGIYLVLLQGDGHRSVARLVVR